MNCNRYSVSQFFATKFYTVAKQSFVPLQYNKQSWQTSRREIRRKPQKNCENVQKLDRPDFWKNSNFRISNENIANRQLEKVNKMALKLFKFLEQLMIDTFLIRSTQFEKTGSIGKFFYFPGKSNN